MECTALPTIKGIKEHTLIDWEGRLATIVFLPGCNFRCPYCHSRHLVLAPDILESIPLQSVDQMLLRNPGWLDGVVISGGEPTLHTGLPLLIRHFRELGLPVKINTNGTDPEMLQRLMRERLIEAVAMDVKAPLDERYERCAGVHVDLDAITESIEMIIASDIAYEFCTTVCPPLLSEQDIIDTAKNLRGAKRFVLQKFTSRDCIDSSLLQVQPYTPEAMRALAAQTHKYVQRCVVRGDYAEDKKPATQ